MTHTQQQQQLGVRATAGGGGGSSSGLLNHNNNHRKKAAAALAMGSSTREAEEAAASSSSAAPGSSGHHLTVPDHHTHMSGPGPGGGGGNGNGHRPYSPVAETLFRKDLISAMKLPDNEPLSQDDYWVVGDTWKQEWEKGVQVPVKPEELREPHVSRLKDPPHSANRFQL